MRRKKKGSTLIVVVIMFMFIMCVSVGMLSLAAGNYSARVSESKRIENLYSSESGLDTAYNIMVKTFNAAAQYGNYSVAELQKKTDNYNNPNNKELYNNLEKDKEEQQKTIDAARDIINQKPADKIEIRKQKDIIKKASKLIEEVDKAIEAVKNEEFKRAFKEFIYDDESKKILSLSKCIEEKKIVTSVEGINNINYSEINFNYNDKASVRTAEGNKTVNLPYLTTDIILNDAGMGKKINLKKEDGHTEDITINTTENDDFTIAIESMFKSISPNSVKIGENIKTVQAIYTMKVPEYNDLFSESSSTDIDDYPILKEKGILVGKDMIVNTGSSSNNGLTIKGDVFVEGQEKDEIKDKTVDKYYGGISINNSKKVELDGKVITRGTFNLLSNTEGKITGDLYAENVYIGSIESGSILSELKNKFKFKDLILDNDFTVKADDTNIEMENFYGINDKNVNDNSHDTGKERTSSSIIINSISDSSSITIKDNAYIMGVAHINTINEYSTGESIGVKGNYAAYSVPLNSSEVFKYDDPLYLLDEDNVFSKAEHFNDYWNDNSDKINKSGIIFEKPENIYSIGALVYKDNTGAVHIRNSNYSNEINGKIEELRMNYASNVYNMGEEATMDDYNSLGKGAVKVENLINFEVLSDNEDDECYYDLDKVIKQGGDMLIINTSENPISIDSSTFGEKINAVIISKGDVNISGDIEICGDIITCGNLNLGTGKITIKHSIDVMKKIQNRYYNIYSQLLFGFRSVDKDVRSQKNVRVKRENSESHFSNYDVNSFLKNNIWKIVK